jgi:hypothetical protein
MTPQRNAQGYRPMKDAIDELIARPQTRNHRELRAFHQFHRKHPEVLDFLVEEIRLRLEIFTAFSYRCLWEYARWKLEMEKGPDDTFMMNDHALPFYARAITILYPEFNGRAEFRKSKADTTFGLCVEPIPEKRPKNYSRRLQWADGTAIERGWHPTTPHVPKPVARRAPVSRKSPVSANMEGRKVRRG